MSNSLPKTVSSSLYVEVRRDQFSGELQVAIHTHPLTDYGYITLSEQEITLDVPQGVNITDLEIETLEETKQTVMAAAQDKLNDLDEQIQSLRSLEHKPDLEVVK